MTMMPQYVFFGIVFAVLTMIDDGIEIAIGAHAANNIFLSVLTSLMIHGAADTGTV
jgi:uncharacterized protein